MTITQITATGHFKPYGADGPAVACPTCGQTRGLAMATRDGEQAVTGICPNNHRWLEKAFTGDEIRELLADIQQEARS